MSESYPILPGGGHSPQSIYEVSSVAATNQSRAVGFHPIGTRAQLEDGRVFYYASNGAVALTAGSAMMGSALSRSGNHDKIVLTDSFANFAAGSKQAVLEETDLDTSDIILNEYADGYMNFENAAGAGGAYYRIVSHDSFDASGSATTGKITLADPLKVTAVATDEITLCRNRHDRVVASSTDEEELLVGVCSVPGGVTASTALATDVTTAESATTTYFFWAQTWGPCAVQVDDTTVALGIAAVSGGTAKEFLTKPATNTSMTVYATGMVPAAAAASDFVMVDLRICP
jgi:hypothetical protein